MKSKAKEEEKKMSKLNIILPRNNQFQEFDYSPPELYVASSLMSPINFRTQVFPYASPQTRSTLLLPRSSLDGSSLNQTPRRPPNCPVTFDSSAILQLHLLVHSCPIVYVYI